MPIEGKLTVFVLMGGSHAMCNNFYLVCHIVYEDDLKMIFDIITFILKSG